MKNYFFSFLLFFLIIKLNAQKKYPKNFTTPLKIPAALSGTFGELRTNHFHTGIDLKTKGHIGMKVHAIGDGYISRVKISPAGYGRAIYITHPNGYTSVYAHLSKLEGAIGEYVRKQQYAQQSFTVDLYLKKGMFKVTQDEVIARSGDSGSSGGPHLHFEIRETSLEIPINPLCFGYKINDTLPPVIKGVYIYPIDGMAGDKTKSIYTVLFKKGVANRSLPIAVSGKVGIEVETYDQTNKQKNKNGVYSIDMYVNGEHTYNFTAEKVSFPQMHYINSHIDYAQKEQYNKWLNKCFLDPDNKLSMYKKFIHHGIITAQPSKKYRVRLVVKDFNGNQSLRTFMLSGKDNRGITKPYDKTAELFDYKNPHKYDSEGIKLRFPAHSFYKNILFKYKKAGNSYQVGASTIPLQKPFTIAIKPKGIPAQDLNKTVLLRDGKSIGGKYKNGWITDKSTKFGSFSLEVDQTPPKIVSTNLQNGSIFYSRSKIEFKIKDNLSGINQYTAKIDGKWVLLAYDKKNDRFTFNFEQAKIPPGNHTFELSITDKKNNRTYVKKGFLKK